ncbi:MAG: hypothetical protein IPG82_18110 [Saprospiraceae bacterium]|nr:hypothetical protein [Saprospiraceae bacterium]
MERTLCFYTYLATRAGSLRNHERTCSRDDPEQWNHLIARANSVISGFPTEPACCDRFQQIENSADFRPTQSARP